MSSGIVTAISARILVDECTRHGLDRNQLQAGLSCNQINEASGKIPVENMYVLWDRAVQLSSDSMFALRVAENAPFGAYRLLDCMLAMSSSPREALDRSCRFFALLNTAFRFSLRASGERMYLELFAPDQDLPRPYSEYLLAIHLFRLRFATQTHLTPLEVHFRHGQTSLAGQYHRIFGSPVKLHQPIDQLVFARDTMNLRHRFSDPELCEVLQEHANRKLNAAGPNQTLVNEVQRILCQNIETGVITLAAVSRQLAMSTRSLQREICAAGTTFRDLLDSVREKHARNLLQDSNLTLTQIADRLHFSDVSSFCRAFRRWTAVLPADCKENQLKKEDIDTIARVRRQSCT